MAEPFAHTSAEDDGPWQPLDEHLQHVEQLARGFGEAIGMPVSAGIVGRAHDVGKAAPAFQEYLRRAAAGHRGPSVDHKTAGAMGLPKELDPLKFILLGHHGGLMDASAVKEKLQSGAAAEALEYGREHGACPTGEDTESSLQELITRVGTDQLALDLCIRMLHSCLVDADALDTEAFTQPGHAAARTTSVGLATLWEEFSRSQEAMIAKADPTPINVVRRQVYEACLAAAELPPGVFRLTVPTGGGKTLSSLGFALEHALKNDLDRVIYAIPFTSIIEQTADVFRKIFSDPGAVLEHHSAVPEPDDADAAKVAQETWRQLASENWDVPLVVTTTVQLFESLFSGKPGAARKVHRLARAVIILDEAQTLPGGLIEPIVSALRELAESYGSTIVLCTATQPALDESAVLAGFSNITEIVREPQEHFRELRRVRYKVSPEPQGWDEIACQLRANEQCLTIANTRADALALFRALNDPDALHLSTLMCPAHRRAVLDKIKERLADDRPCRVVSTQLVEAGVDLDFPVVFRAVGPLDRIVQAAGRCNREGRLESGSVIVFTPADGHMPPGVYRTASGVTDILLRLGETDWDDPAVFQDYFKRVYASVETDNKHIQALRKACSFHQVRDRFHMIPDDTVPVLVAYDKEEYKRLTRLFERDGGIPARSDWRRLEQLSVSLRYHDLQRALRDGLAAETAPDAGVFVWSGAYDPVTGLGFEMSDPSDLIG